MIVIGVTGTLGAGKGTVAQYLVSKGFKHFSVRDYLTKILLEEKKPVNRETMLALANGLREKYGFSYITDKVFEEAEKSKHNAIIESFRHPDEIKSLQNKSNFYLFSVDAPIKTRYLRIKKRASATDKINFEEFKKQEERETKNKSNFASNLFESMKLANFKFENNGTEKALYKKIDMALKKINRRPTWDEYFMEVANSISKRATCDRGRSGCVIAKDKQILCSGYVGSPIGFPHCDEAGHLLKKLTHEDGTITEHCMRTVHAEQNALCQAARKGVALDGATVYCRMTPCRTCAMLLINCGIKRIVCEKKYHAGAESEAMFKKAKIKLVFQNEEVQKY